MNASAKKAGVDQRSALGVKLRDEASKVVAFAAISLARPGNRIDLREVDRARYSCDHSPPRVEQLKVRLETRPHNSGANALQLGFATPSRVLEGTFRIL